jgi:cyclohexanecarboxyl-CoA dehydrogenase
MDFAFSEDEEVFRDTVRRFANERLAPHYQSHDRDKSFPEQQLKDCASLGLLGLRVPAEYGGSTGPCSFSGIACEEVAHADFNVAYFPLMYGLVGELLANYASDELKRLWLPSMALGQVVTGLGLTEPESGSDAAHLRCSAVRDGDGYVLTGEKSSISLLERADMVTVFARTGTIDDGARGISAFVVPTDLPGVQRTTYHSMGSKCLGRGSLFLDGVRVPETWRIGAEGQAFKMVMATFDYSRATIGLMCLGTATAAVNRTKEHVTIRRAFGRPLAGFQGVSFPIAEHLTFIEAARLLCYKTLWLRDRGLPHTTEAAMCKWWAPKVAVDAIHDCLLLHGHYGYTDEYPIEQQLRDVIGLEIGDGTAQIAKVVIARDQLGRESPSR